MLETRSISRRFGALLAVDDVSFTVNHGEVVGLLGHNGAGKTTIMKMLSGALEPDSGSILLDGESVLADPTRLQRRLGYLPEHLPLYPELSIASYLDYAAGVKGLRGDARRVALREAIEAAELGPRLLSPIGTLSRGLKQRVGVAQALLGRPSILILDEPTNGLDPEQTERMRALIRRLSTAATVILSTHVMQEVEAVCDRALIVRAGRLAVDARLDELTHGDQVRLVTGGDEAAVRSALLHVEGVRGATVTPPGTGGAAPADGTCWTLALDRDGLARGAGAVIAGLVPALVAADVEVRAIAPDTRDLQSLFLEVGGTDGASGERATGTDDAEVRHGR